MAWNGNRHPNLSQIAGQSNEYLAAQIRGRREMAPTARPAAKHTQSLANIAFQIYILFVNESRTTWRGFNTASVLVIGSLGPEGHQWHDSMRFCQFRKTVGSPRLCMPYDVLEKRDDRSVTIEHAVLIRQHLPSA